MGHGGPFRRTRQELDAGKGWTVTAEAGAGRHRVEGHAVATGAGVVLTLTGGDRPHVGAVALGIPRPSQRDPARTSASSSVLTVTGHRDDELAKPLADLAASRLGQVAVGVHVEGAAAGDIALLAENAREVAALLLDRLAGDAT